MKECKACGEEFESQFSFCPLDRELLVENQKGARYEYRPTLISDKPLAHRLTTELSFLVDLFRQAWPGFKSDPIAFGKIKFDQLTNSLKRAVARPHVLTGSLTAAAIIACTVLSVMLFDRHLTGPASIDESDDLVRTVTIDFKTEPNPESNTGIGAGEKGRVGFEKGRGEGSRPVPARTRGGGVGGTNNPLPPSQGRPPVPSTIPAPIPTTYARLRPQALPEAGIDIDPVLWKNLPFPTYGDPRSKSNVASNGPGIDGGVGTGKGQGIGEGENNGFGPGRKGNTGGGDRDIGGGRKGGADGDSPGDSIDRIYRSPEVTTRARVLSKPEPQYTEEARRNQITGTVILSVVFSRSGQVTNIRAVQPLCCGLTERAIASARQIRFVPATRNGQPVSMYMQLEYNFNLY